MKTILISECDAGNNERRVTILTGRYHIKVDVDINSVLDDSVSIGSLATINFIDADNPDNILNCDIISGHYFNAKKEREFFRKNQDFVEKAIKTLIHDEYNEVYNDEYETVFDVESMKLKIYSCFYDIFKHRDRDMLDGIPEFEESMENFVYESKALKPIKLGNRKLPKTFQVTISPCNKSIRFDLGDTFYDENGEFDGEKTYYKFHVDVPRKTADWFMDCCFCADSNMDEFFLEIIIDDLGRYENNLDPCSYGTGPDYPDYRDLDTNNFDLKWYRKKWKMEFAYLTPEE